MNHYQPFAQYLEKNQFRPAIAILPEQAPRMMVVIPCYKEPDVLRSLQSLYQCHRSESSTEVIIVINHPDDATDEAKRQNETSLIAVQLWIEAHHDTKLHFHVVYMPDVPSKVAGVGWARKTGMDEAVYRLLQCGVDDGVIIGFDADSVCDENYLVEIERAFFDGPHIHGASIYFEHPIEGNEYDTATYEGIIQYELHLRYLNQALRYAGFPYAYHTVGSAFAVRAEAYVKQGGMNKRKAGEDFHFLHKIIPLGNYSEINTTRVVPSPRESDRVPFGTGASIRQWMNNEEKTLYTYPLESFTDLKHFFALIPEFFKASPENIQHHCSSLSLNLQNYLEQNKYIEHILQASANSASLHTFTKRFFGWFDGLKTVKYLNDSCRRDDLKKPVVKAAALLLQKLGYGNVSSAKDLVHIYRKIEREGLTRQNLNI